MTMALIGLSAKSPQTAQDVSGMANTVYGLLSKGYSREDELFADRLAVRYLLRAGYDPEALVRSLEILKKESGPGGRVFEVLSTHPRMDERIKKAREDITIEKAALAAKEEGVEGTNNESIVDGR
jgi:predicted Zn-dependent protease